jgi:HlyD family secretion protein
VVSAEVPGKVITVHQDSGDEVVKGEALIDIDATDTFLQISQARANLARAQEGIVQAQTQLSLARSNYQRMKAMYDSGELAETLLEQSANALELAQSGVQSATEARRQAQAQVDLLTHQLEKAKVDSPLSGQILERYVEAGELVNVGTKLFSVADLSHLWLDVYVPESKLGLVQVGQEAEITVDSFPDEVFEGKVIFINGEAEFTPKNIQTKEERSKLVYRVRLDVPNPDNKLKIGMPADADILVGE